MATSFESSSSDLIYSPWLRRFAEDLASQGKRQATVECYCRDARHFLTFWEQLRLPLESVDPKSFEKYQTFLSEKKKDRSIRRSAIGVRQFFRFLHKEGVFQESPLETATLLTVPEYPPSLISFQDYAILQKACEGEPDLLKRARDLAILALLGWEGLKVGELCGLEWEDYLPGSPPSLKVRGEKERCLILYGPTRERLDAYKSVFMERAPDLWLKKPKMIIAFKGQIHLKPFPQVSRHGVKFTLMEWSHRTGLSGVCAESLRHHAVQFMNQNRGFDAVKITLHLGLRSQLLASQLCKKPLSS